MVRNKIQWMYVLNAYDLFKAASPTVRAKALNN